MRKPNQGKPDFILLIIVAVLLLLGIIILASVSTALSQQKFNSTTVFLLHYLIFGLAPAIALGFLAFKIPLSFLRKRAVILLFLNLFLMILVFLPEIGISSGGANRWLNLGFISLQPSEFLKLSSIIYFAAWLPAVAEKTRKKNVYATFAAFVIIICLIGLLLVFQKDVGTLVIIIITAALMYFLAETPLRHSFLILGTGVTALLFLIKITPYRFERLKVFLNPDIDPMGFGFQIKQALIAVGSGGIWGKGFGMSAQKFGSFLPQSMTDTIFPIFAEEAGLIGSFILILIFVLFAWQGFKIAQKVQDKFLKLTCLGIVLWLTIQAFVNIGAMLRLLPLTGIPLPFISYGGSALVAELIGVGILLNISKKT